MLVKAMSDVARLIVDPPASGTWNMAVDQAMLMAAEESNQITLRFYRWSEPTLSLGYFQKYTDRQGHAASNACPLVRRRTGGGAIVHDQELTYSLAVPSKNRWSGQNAELYDLVHQEIIKLWAGDGVEASLFRDAEVVVVEADQPKVDPNAFLCFQRRSAGDIVCRGHKVVGSAQRRLKNALLQHGSILLARSNAAPELLGVKELTNRDHDIGFLTAGLAEAIQKRLGLSLVPGAITNQEHEVAEQVQADVFAAESWSKKR
jgi:lipoate-protein ligase A